MEREDERGGWPSLERKRLEVASRIRCVCQQMPEEEFRALVERMVELDVKFAERRAEEFVTLAQDW